MNDPLFKQHFAASPYKRMCAADSTAPAKTRANRRERKHRKIQEDFQYLKSISRAPETLKIEDSSSKNPILLLRSKEVPDSLEVPHSWRHFT